MNHWRLRNITKMKKKKEQKIKSRYKVMHGYKNCLDDRILDFRIEKVSKY